MQNYKIYHFNSLTSTQDKAKEFSKKNLENIVVIADGQTKGRGRFKRKWHSSKEGLWMSILVKPKNIEKLQYLTFAAAICVVKSIKKIVKIKTDIKWPNDVLYKNKKLCGILTEGIFGKENFVVVGIGLNLNQTNFPSEIKNLATSLKIIKKTSFDKNEFANVIVGEFFNFYENFYSKNKFDKIMAEWKKYCNTIGKSVLVTTKTGTVKGKVIGVDDECNLLLKLKNEKIIKIMEGDVTIRY